MLGIILIYRSGLPSLNIEITHFPYPDQILFGSGSTTFRIWITYFSDRNRTFLIRLNNMEIGQCPTLLIRNAHFAESDPDDLCDFNRYILTYVSKCMPLSSQWWRLCKNIIKCGLWYRSASRIQTAHRITKANFPERDMQFPYSYFDEGLYHLDPDPEQTGGDSAMCRTLVV